VTTLSEPFTVSPPAISKHLRVLESSGLIVRRKVGRVHFCRFRGDGLNQAGEWIQHQQEFWQQQFKALSNFLDTDKR
jgi:DNA-binding transcriptional ArsR family regulator